MGVGACVHVSKDFRLALDCYSKYLNLPYNWQPFKVGEKYSVKQEDFFLLHNNIPEELRTIDALRQLHSHPTYCAIPIIFVSEVLSEEAENLTKEVEFIWRVDLPFDSGKFFHLLKDIDLYFKKNAKLLERRTSIQIAIHRKEFETARSLYKLIEKDYPHPYRLHMMRGEIAYGLSLYDEAVAAVKEAQQEIPNTMESDSLLARAYLGQGDEVKHREVLAAMTQKAELHLKNMIHWGHVYVERGETLKSLSVYERALENDPKNIEAQEGFLAANLINGKTEVVKEIMEGSAQAMELARLCNLKGISMAKQGQYRSAQKLYRNAMNFLPDKSAEHKLWYNLGLCMKKKGDLKDALKMFEKSAESSPPTFKKAAEQIEDVENQIKEKKAAEDREKNKSVKDSLTLNYESIKH